MICTIELHMLHLEAGQKQLVGEPEIRQTEFHDVLDDAHDQQEGAAHLMLQLHEKLHEIQGQLKLRKMHDPEPTKLAI